MMCDGLVWVCGMIIDAVLREVWCSKGIEDPSSSREGRLAIGEGGCAE